MAGLTAPSDVTSFKLGGLELAGGAFKILNARRIMAPAPKSRSNVAAAELDADLGRQSRRTGRTVDLEVLVTGTVNASGNVPAGVFDTNDLCDTNEDVLRAATFDAPEDDFGCIELDLVKRDGQRMVGGVQVDDFAPGAGASERVVVMQITVPDGELSAVESP